MSEYIIIAGKTEGFDINDGHTVRVDSEAAVREAIFVLYLQGYKDIVISEVIGNIEEFIGAKAVAG